jgi:hypothetical protein
MQSDTTFIKLSRTVGNNFAFLRSEFLTAAVTLMMAWVVTWYGIVGGYQFSGYITPVFTLKMETLCFSERLVTTYRTMWCQPRRPPLKPYISFLLPHLIKFCWKK